MAELAIAEPRARASIDLRGGPRCPVEFDRFVAVLAHELSPWVPPGSSAACRLVEDLGWDSLLMMEALAFLDQWDLDLPEELLPAICTLGDLHHWACAVGQRRDGTPLSGDPGSCGELVTPNTRLRPLGPDDEGWAHALHLSGSRLVSSRLRGATPSPTGLHRLLWEGVLAQFVVTGVQGAPLGIVTCFDPDFERRHAHVAAVANDDCAGTGLVLEGMAALASYAFSHWDLRKLYAETLEGNYRAFASGSARVFAVEGVLREHEYRAGRWEDLYLLSVTRESWRVQHRRLLGTAPAF